MHRCGQGQDYRGGACRGQLEIAYAIDVLCIPDLTTSQGTLTVRHQRPFQAEHPYGY